MKKSDSFRSLQKQTAWKTAVARVLNWPINGNCIAPDWSILFCQAVIYFPLSTVCFESCQFLTSDLSFWILVLENVKSENWTVKTERFKFLCDNYLPYMPLTSLWTWTCSEPSSEPDIGWTARVGKGHVLVLPYGWWYEVDETSRGPKLDSDKKGMFHQGPSLPLWLWECRRWGSMQLKCEWSEKCSRVLQKQDSTTYHWNHLYKSFETTITYLDAKGCQTLCHLLS